MARRLEPRFVEKPWGVRDLSPWFDTPDTPEPIGEIIFEPGPGAPLLVKYLFTSQALSIQVHPDEATASIHGGRSGKEEAWLILAADPGARVALGLTAMIDKHSLAEAARSGAIEQMLHWVDVAAGDVIHVPPGTIHALGAGITLLEIQQNADITYRLYDYGRPRALHVDQAVEAAFAGPYGSNNAPRALARNHDRLVDGGRFSIDRLRGPGRGTIRTDMIASLIPIGGGFTLNGRAEPAPSVVELGPGLWEIAAEAECECLIAFPRSEAGGAAITWKPDQD